MSEFETATDPPKKLHPVRFARNVAIRTIFLLACLTASAGLLVLQKQSDDPHRSLSFQMSDKTGYRWALDCTIAMDYLWIGWLRWTPTNPSVSQMLQPIGFQYKSWTGHDRLWGWGLAYFSLFRAPKAESGRLFGVEWVHAPAIDVGGATENAWAIGVPLLMAAGVPVLVGLWPVYGIVRLWVRKRRKVCLRCGYPLSGPICTECGTPTTSRRLSEVVEQTTS